MTTTVSVFTLSAALPKMTLSNEDRTKARYALNHKSTNGLVLLEDLPAAARDELERVEREEAARAKQLA